MRYRAAARPARSWLLPWLVLLPACSSGGGDPDGDGGDGGGGGAPFASAGGDRAVLQNDRVALDGSGSSDPEGDSLAFRWRIASAPSGSRAALDDAQAERPMFTPDLAGDFVVELVVSDARHDSAPDRATITASADGSVRVGPGRRHRTPAEAAAAVAPGATVSIDPGTYRGDDAVATWWQDDLTIRAGGGPVELFADGANAQGKGIWVVAGDRTSITGISFAGARVPDGNGAGIRLEGAGLTLTGCRFDDNEMAFLSGNHPESDIVFERCQLHHSTGTGALGHNVYANRVRSLVLRGCYIHHATRGHNIKSRAARTEVWNCRVMDERDGRSSYVIDLPNGGLGLLVGNLIQQGPDANNPTVISFGEEGLVHPLNELHVVHNTIVNDGPEGTFVSIYGGASGSVVNNVVTGPGVLLRGNAHADNNVVSGTPGLVDRAGYDYGLTAESPAIDAAIEVGAVYGTALTPLQEYAHPAGLRVRAERGRRDVGALER